ncbi:hypothetical protein M404DRAFT_991290 [Pisolithus tinctorius Marx 270]|uniref:Uncharacterized protein n=1 Tax=Pisolithus tinctorius Marx 270 TaxID=870435 RepID=A0A0C3PYZ7_PISTI|nr:hypothetical protein M404DRAFT_991290 [Pisolithus tinctorius Marx 270]
MRKEGLTQSRSCIRSLLLPEPPSPWPSSSDAMEEGRWKTFWEDWWSHDNANYGANSRRVCLTSCCICIPPPICLGSCMLHPLSQLFPIRH